MQNSVTPIHNHKVYYIIIIIIMRSNAVSLDQVINKAELTV